MTIRKRAHQTVASQRMAGADATAYWEFQPGQRVRVIEGFLGTVVAVEDGPHPGLEAYEVTLDDGMGGGTYAAGELSVAGTTATLACDVDEEDEDDVTLPAASGSNHTAADDYPVLAEILVERPPPLHAITAAVEATERPREPDGSFGRNPPTCEVCGAPAVVSVPGGWHGSTDLCGDCANEIGATEGSLHEARGGPTKAQKCKWCDNQAVKSFLWAEGAAYIPFCAEHEAKTRQVIEEENHDEVLKTFTITSATTEAGIIDRLLDPWARGVIKRLPPELKPGAQGPGSMWSYDWCRFRKNRRCMYAKELNAQATEIAGYAVWVPVDRGLCPRDKWNDQKVCPVAEPGPHSGEPHARIDATVPWEQGGQRGGVPESAMYAQKAGSLESVFAAYFHKDGRPLTIQERGKLAVEHGLLTETEVSTMLADKLLSQKLRDRTEALVFKLWARGEYDMRSQVYEPGPPPQIDQEALEWARSRVKQPVAAAKAPFEFFAAWGDIREKAKRIRSEGGVRILSATDRHIAGQVQGSGAVYNTEIEYAPGGKALAVWDCDCPWARYAWGRSPQWKKFEGRQCAHSLALLWEAQSRGMFGRTIEEDQKTLAKQGKAMPANLLPDPEPEEVAQWMAAEVQRIEPNVSRDLAQAAKRGSGKLEGFDFRFKGMPRLVEKLREKWDRVIREGDPFKVVDDVLRYTMVFSPADWSHDLTIAAYALEEQGYDLTRPQNAFAIPGDAYAGLHWTLHHRPSDIFIELQCHSTDSWDVKQNKTHALLEEFRRSSTPLKRKQEIWDIMARYFDEIPIPAGAPMWGEPKHYPRPASLHPSLRRAPAVSMAEALLSSGESIVAVASLMQDLGGDGAAIVSEAMGARPFNVQVPGRGVTKAVGIEDGQVVLEDGSQIPPGRVLYPSFHPTKGLSLVGKIAAEADESGVMVALRPPEPVCDALAQEGGEPVENMHVTLAYLGSTNLVSQEALRRAVVGFSWAVGPVVGRISGYGQFASEDGAVLVALWDVPGLDRFRVSLLDFMADEGLTTVDNHGFTPHQTIAYADTPFKTFPKLPEDAEGEHEFGSIILAFGGEWEEYPLNGLADPLAMPQSVDSPDFYPPESFAWVGPNGVQHGAAKEPTTVMDMPRAIRQMTEPCPKCRKWMGGRGQCWNCGYRVSVPDRPVQIAAANMGEWHNSDGFSPDATNAELALHLMTDHPHAADKRNDLPTDTDELDQEHAEDHDLWGECGAHDETLATIEGLPPVGTIPNDPRLPPDCIEDRLATVTELHPPEEPALPSTTGEDEDDDFLEGKPIAPGDPKLSWLMAGTSGPATREQAQRDNSEIAAAAREALAKMGAKVFTPAEQQQIINEGGDIGASNLASLDITGTHYEALEAALLDAEDEGVGLWL